MKYLLLTLLILASTSCNSQEKKSSASENSIEPVEASQIAQYVTDIFKDSKGHFWFGTIEKGIAKYDGNSLKYYTKNDGLPSNRVTGVIEDSISTLWFNTGNGLSKFDGSRFTNFSISDDFSSNMISQLFIDSKGVFWIGTWNGVYTFNGNDFNYFSMPYPKVETAINEDTKNWITEITEDSEGNIWIARDGYGISKYDGKSFQYILKKDGLHSNNVTDIVFDDDGSIWIGTRVSEKDNPDPKKRVGKGGVNKMIENTITSFPEINAFNNNDVYQIYKDRLGIIWISTVKDGIYKFDGQIFKKYDVPISIMSMLDDKKGNLWLGGAGGLYRLNQKGEITNITTNGPWN